MLAPRRFASLLALTVCLACFSCEEGADSKGSGSGASGTCIDGSAHLLIADAGLRTPESVLHDPQADLYLISNISGGSGDRDGDGFISRVAPDGTMLELKWIDGGAQGVELHAPKGMAVAGEHLYVTDIAVVRDFDRESGAPVRTIEFDDAGFLNDLVADGEGALYVSDMSRDRIHRIDLQQDPPVVETVLEAGIISNPNGVSVDAEQRLWAVAGDQLFRVEDGKILDATQLPTDGLDGIEWRSTGSILVSSWASNSIYERASGSSFAELACELRSPADIGYDATRDRLLVPLFELDRVAAVPLSE
jgi:sugar lactone lactonase YvrE